MAVTETAQAASMAGKKSKRPSGFRYPNADEVYQYKDARDWMLKTGIGIGARSKDIGRIIAFFGAAKAKYNKRMEAFAQKQRKTSITRSAVQRRAFFETPDQPAQGGMRTTTGAS